MDEIALTTLVDAVDADQPDLLRVDREILAGLTVRDVTQDSRAVGPGALFCALRGTRSDGHEWIEAAVDAGAVAVLADEVRTARVPTIVSSNARRATGHLAAEFQGRPSERLDLIGVTGTNGKTTVVTMIEHVARALGRSSSSMGTLTGPLTTSAAPEFQQYLRHAVDSGVELVAAEVSSHALDQFRVDGSRFRVAVFTNLTQDHLDYHGDMASYFAAKSRLFTDGLARVAVIDVSSDAGRRLAEVSDIPVRGVDPTGVRVVDVGPGGSSFDVEGRTVRIPLAGRFNIANALLVHEVFRELGGDPDDVFAALETIPQIPGRFEWVDVGQPFGVVVDYAHTPAGLDVAIAAAREVASARVIVVFGCGGDRDPGKRPLMGRAASAADVVHVTSDNPRSEDPAAIIADVLTGVEHDDVRPESDRRAAISAAVADARAGDVVLIAGKGHEDRQTIGSTSVPFDDRDVAADALADAGWGRHT